MQSYTFIACRYAYKTILGQRYVLGNLGHILVLSEAMEDILS